LGNTYLEQMKNAVQFQVMRHGRLDATGRDCDWNFVRKRVSRDRHNRCNHFRPVLHQVVRQGLTPRRHGVQVGIFVLFPCQDGKDFANRDAREVVKLLNAHGHPELGARLLVRNQKRAHRVHQGSVAVFWKREGCTEERMSGCQSIGNIRMKRSFGCRLEKGRVPRIRGTGTGSGTRGDVPKTSAAGFTTPPYTKAWPFAGARSPMLRSAERCDRARHPGMRDGLKKRTGSKFQIFAKSAPPPKTSEKRRRVHVSVSFSPRTGDGGAAYFPRRRHWRGRW
jgi:hypothetical protein